MNPDNTSILEDLVIPASVEVELPVIQPLMEIGRINPEDKNVVVDSQHHIQFRCSFSTDCCVKPQIPVTDFDIYRIEQRGYELDQIIEKAVPILRFAKNLDAERTYWIKKKPFTGSCTFLEGDRCSIHQFKPFACKIFPFQLIFEKNNWVRVVIHKSNLCQSVRLVAPDKAENKRLLQMLLETINAEDSFRMKYFERFGRD